VLEREKEREEWLKDAAKRLTLLIFRSVREFY